MRKYVWVFGLLLLTSTEAPADDTKQLLVRGAGQENCARWVRERANWLTGASQAYLNWVLGFIAAYNDFVHTQQPAATAGVDVGVESDPIAAWIDQYCRANPNAAIYTASTALINNLKDRANLAAATNAVR
jgi:hypothetical protein